MRVLRENELTLIVMTSCDSMTLERQIILSKAHWWFQTRARPGDARVKFWSIVLIVSHRNSAVT